MKEIFINVSEHASSSLERVIGRFEAVVLMPVLNSCMTGEDCCYVEYYGGFFVGERVLRSGLVGECIEPKQRRLASDKLHLAIKAHTK